MTKLSNIKPMAGIGFILVWLLSANTANASPPPVGSEDYEIMKDFSEWVQAQTTPEGYGCCDIADGRPVDARITKDGQWEAFISVAKFGYTAPDAWRIVPAQLYKNPVKNPIGLPILYWYNGEIRCFIPPNVT